NLAYQGRFWRHDWHLLNLDPRLFTPDHLEFYGDINFLKGGLVFADHITTVSPRYALEIQRPEMGEGLDGVLRARAAHLTGILNGVDVHEWDPATDPHLPAHYDGASLAGKSRCKAAVLTELRLTSRPGAPLLVAVSPFARHHGLPLIIPPSPPHPSSPPL